MLMIDVGNTETDIGSYAGDRLQHHWRLQTRTGITADELAALLYSLLQSHKLNLHDVRHVLVASVVPALHPVLLATFPHAQVRFVDHQMPFSFRIALDQPSQVGADRLVNAEAVCRLYGKPAIIVDAGTATTFCVIDAQGNYRGGAIAPGMHSAFQGLVQRAAKLSHMDLQPNQRWLGNSTESALRSGSVNGHAAMIDGMVTRLQGELGWGKETYTVATGGFVHMLEPLLTQIRFFDALLTLKGLRLLAEAAFSKDTAEVSQHVNG